MNVEQANYDENVPAGQIPNSQEIGRQVKRLKTSAILSECPEVPIVTDGSVGDRQTRLVEMSLQKLANNPNQDQTPLVAAIGVAIAQACLPNGPISNAISNAIAQACLPNGPISNAINTGVNRLEQRIEARYLNDLCRQRNCGLVPLPADNGMPINFPETLNDFWTMPAAQLNLLLAIYSLPQNGTIEVKKNRLARFCHVKNPID